MFAPSKNPKQTSDMRRLGCICRAPPTRLLHQAPVLRFSSPLISHHTSPAQMRHVLLQHMHPEHAPADRSGTYTSLISYIGLKCIAQSSPYACLYHHRTQSMYTIMCVFGCVYAGLRRLVCSTRHHSISAVPSSVPTWFSHRRFPCCFQRAHAKPAPTDQSGM